jgi:hypothetical protein
LHLDLPHAGKVAHPFQIRQAIGKRAAQKYAAIRPQYPRNFRCSCTAIAHMMKREMHQHEVDAHRRQRNAFGPAVEICDSRMRGGAFRYGAHLL